MLLFLMLNSLMNSTSEPSRRGGLLGRNQRFVFKFSCCFILIENPQEGVDCTRSRGHLAS